MSQHKHDTPTRLLPFYFLSGLCVIVATIPAYGYILGMNAPTDSSPFVSLLRNGVFIGGIKAAFSSILVPLIVKLLLKIKYPTVCLDDAIVKQMTEVHLRLIFEVVTVIFAPMVYTLLLDGGGSPACAQH